MTADCQNVVSYCGALYFPNQVANTYENCVIWEFDLLTTNPSKNHLRGVIYDSEVQSVLIEYNNTQTSSFDIDKLALAVAKHETGNCTLGTGVKYNNCFGIKNGNTAPCDRISTGGFCIYNNTEESFEAFKIIWNKWYGELPTYDMAVRWSGNDRAAAWRNNVINFYNEM